MSIVACKIFEDELLHVLSLEKAFDYLFIVSTPDSHDLVRRLKHLDLNFTIITQDKVTDMLNAVNNKGFFSFVKKNNNKFTIIVHMMELGLHSDPHLLRSAVYDKIEQISAYSDSILVFYGLCGNSLKHIETDFSHITCPLFFLKDEEGMRVEDCISTALGGNTAYDKAFEKCRGTGTIFFTPMWAANWRAVNTNNISEDIDKLQNSFKKQHIEKIIKINTSASYNRHFEDNMDKFVKHFNLDIGEMPGNMQVAEKSFLDAKKQTIQLSKK